MAWGRFAIRAAAAAHPSRNENQKCRKVEARKPTSSQDAAHYVCVCITVLGVLDAACFGWFVMRNALWVSVCARMVFCVLCVVLNAVYALCSVLYAVYGVVRSA